MNKLEDHNYNGIHATIIADSKNEHGNRITSFIVTLPRIVLAELNTHRMLSRNSASSRAIPFKTMVERCNLNPFIPLEFQADHSGMQGNKILEGTDLDFAIARWVDSSKSAIVKASQLNKIGVTKQLCNRLLEPFMWHTAIITATEWENFYALRAHPAAEIHIADLAEKMLIEANLSEPKQLKADEWHIPLGDNMNLSKIGDLATTLDTFQTVESLMIKIATARCARVSYLNYEGNDDYEADIKLHDRLADMGHWSPFEHCARAMSFGEFDSSFHKGFEGDGPNFYSNGWSGNFRGFTQYRKTFTTENKRDSRLLKK